MRRFRPVGPLRRRLECFDADGESDGGAGRLAAETADEHTFRMVKRRSRIVAPDKPTLGQVGSVGVSFVAFLVLLFLCISHGLL